MSDANGNDVTAVGVPVTGHLGIAPGSTTIPTPSEGGTTGYVLPAAFTKAGLLKTDGGPQWAWAASGDPIEFWQDGYSIPSGLADVTVVATFAQTDDFIRSIVYGKTPDSNGYLTVDGGGHATEYVLFTEEIFKSGWIRRRVAPSAQVQTVAEDKSTRGEVLGYQVTFKINRSALVNNDHFGEWLIAPAAAAVPTIATATPATAAAGTAVVITGTGFVGVTSVKFGAVTSALYRVDSSTQITATMPAGSAGAAAVTVTNAAGTSAAFTYTRGA